MIVYKLQKEIEVLYEKIERIQNECSHPESVVTKEHKGSNGHYDPSDDRYWTEYTCQLCDKNWTVEDK